MSTIKSNVINKGELFYSEAEKQISGCFKFLYDYEKAFIYFTKSGYYFEKNKSSIREEQSYRRACDIYQNHFDIYNQYIYKIEYNIISRKIMKKANQNLSIF
jgi:hypothetical protein